MCAGRYLTAKISEYPNHEIECTLSDIIEDNVPEKYYLSRKQAEKLLYKENPTQGERIYSSKGLSCTLTSGSGGFGGHSGLYLIENTENFGLPIKSKTKDGYQIAYPGDSIDTAFSEQNSRRSRVGSQIAHTLTTSATQAVFYLLPERENDRISHRSLTQSVKLVGRNESNEMDNCVHFIDLNPDPKLTEIARCITARHDSGISNRKAEHSGVFVDSTNIADDEKFAVAFVEPNGEVHIGRIRKLTPRECGRLQGNDCTEIRNLYDGYSFFDFTRLHNMKQRINAGEQFPELLISNYDMYERQRNKPLQLSLLDLTTEQQIDLEQILKECILRKH